MDNNMSNYGNFIFGSPIEKIIQKERSIKKVFVLGKYPSAVHAKFVSKNIKCNALAIKSEPYIFWKGDGAEYIINQINELVPKNYGEFILPDKIFNGPTGKLLDEQYLYPLKYSREDAWLCDLIPYFMVNKYSKQYNAQKRINEYFKNDIKYISNIQTVPKNIDDNRINEIVNEIEASKADTIILLGQDAIKWFICKVSNCKKTELREFYPYGKPHNFKFINNKEYKIYPLVHPHHIENGNKDWMERHSEWIKNI